ncbi:MAG TPA: hypothetical protein VD859_00770 [Nocardioides sp.]|nr:hypothetical protein [Nocardioides sp.]
MLKVLLVVAVFAAVTYFAVRAMQSRGVGPTPPRSTRPRRPSTPPRPVAPDDDEDFLRDLDRKRLNPEDPNEP